MRKISIFIIMCFCLIVQLAYGSEQKQPARYLNQHKLSTGLTAVVAEGDLEPRSIGSYSVRIYGANPEYPTDDYICSACLTPGHQTEIRWP
jgi:hypothetical protein